jgi:uncharacterized membrane-anchored protein YitT (DUF2179 family)
MSGQRDRLKLAVGQEADMRGKPWTNLWAGLIRSAGMTLGALLAALGYSLFQVPYDIAAGGVSGISIIITTFTGWPVGLMILLMNVPLLFLGYLRLGRWRFVARTVVSVVVFAVAVDAFVAWLPGWLEEYPVSDDVLLSAIYAGLLGGIGGGLVYRAGGTLGGTGILGRILQQKIGAPLSQVYVYTDGMIILAAGIAFGWELAMYALLTLFLSGVASDYTLEGPSSVRTATIITDQPERVSQALIDVLGRGASTWPITGGYTGEQHWLVLCTIYRSQVNELKQVVARTDRQAFLVIGVAHQALGVGFQPLPV